MGDDTTVGSTTGPLAGGTPLEQPLLGATTGRAPGQTVVPVIRLIGGDTSQNAMQASDFSESDDGDAAGAGLLQSIIILAKAIVGAGSAALPFAFARLGLVVSISFLYVVAFMTHYSIEALTMATIATGHTSYPSVVEAVLGKPSAVLLELSLVLRCAGLMVVYIVIATDILAGSKALPGLLCDVLGGLGSGWCDHRLVIAAVLSIFILVPLVTPKRLSAARATSIIGLSAAGLWACVTVAVAVLAWLSGESHAVQWLPSAKSLGGGSLTEQAITLLATLPVIATAYTCQMTVHFVMKDLETFNQTRMGVVSAVAVSLCTVFFLSVGVGSGVAFGRHVPADVLELFSQKVLRRILPDTVAWLLGIAVRLAFLLSILANFPMQMLPFRQSLSRLAFGRDLEGRQYYALTYASLAGFYILAMTAKSIWTPLQLVGATAGALIAFFFPAFVVLRMLRLRAWVHVSKPGYWKANAWGLVVLGVVQAVTGVTAVVLNGRKT